EELLSINEELQSTNEELETSREEAQSVNEELNTVNSELQRKVEELDRANDNLRNLFEGTEIGLVFLDKELVIRSFTPAIKTIFNLIDLDRGRPLTDIVSELADLNLRNEIEPVLANGKSRDGRVVVEGPPVLVKAMAAVGLGMALHELAANAARQGALSVPPGRVRLSWSIEEPDTPQARLVIRWREAGGPAAPPAEPMSH